ncbi:MAG: hypothetical protein N3A56_03950, partial [Thermodesulfobacteriaceae bacterium]|nr:hypothetical protein [Thermodesulfobacteriaceae bacterium]
YTMNDLRRILRINQRTLVKIIQNLKLQPKRVSNAFVLTEAQFQKNKKAHAKIAHVKKTFQIFK